MAARSVNSGRYGGKTSPAIKSRHTNGAQHRNNNKNNIYEKGKFIKTASKAFLWLVLTLILLCIIIFFLFKSWTVYDSDGAHIIFPWKTSAYNIMSADGCEHLSNYIISLKDGGFYTNGGS